LSRKRNLRPFIPKPNKRFKPNQKLPNKHTGIVKKLVDRTLKCKLPDFRPEKILEQSLARCLVDTSAKMGLLGDISKLSVAFDGSPYKSGASHYGVKVCDCRSKGIYNCTCKRRCQTLMQPGAGIAIAISGSTEALSLLSPLLIAPMTYLYTLEQSRLTVTTALPPSSP